jgi:hypothetical protein
MAIDLKQLDSSIEQLEARKRKLEKLRELLNDADTRELISDPEIMGMIKGSEFRTNGNHPAPPPVWEEAPPGEPAEGSLRAKVLEVARACPGKFDLRYVLEKLKLENYQFGAKEPKVSIHGALMSLSDSKKRLIRLVRRGAGRQPNIYEAVRKEGTK